MPYVEQQQQRDDPFARFWYTVILANQLDARKGDALASLTFSVRLGVHPRKSHSRRLSRGESKNAIHRHELRRFHAQSASF